MVDSIHPHQQVVLLNGVTATGASDAVLPKSRHTSFRIKIADTATVQIRGSHDGSDWAVLTTKTATTTVHIHEWYPQLDANVSSHSSGAVTVTMWVAPRDG